MFSLQQTCICCKVVSVRSRTWIRKVGVAMVGERLRAARQRQNLSLQEVAALASISAATLSRIETGKQALDVSMMQTLADILNIRATELMEGAARSGSEIASELASMDPKARRAVWNELAAGSRNRRTQRKSEMKQLALEVEELLAQIDFVRAEIEGVKKRLK